MNEDKFLNYLDELEYENDEDLAKWKAEIYKVNYRIDHVNAQVDKYDAIRVILKAIKTKYTKGE